MTTTTTTAAAEFTATIARYFRIGARTRRYRNGMDLHSEIIEAVKLATTIPGYFTENTEAALRPAWAAACGYEKHILGYRVDGTVVCKINAMTPHQFAKMLGQMIDQGVSCAYEAEQFFKAL